MGAAVASSCAPCAVLLTLLRSDGAGASAGTSPGTERKRGGAQPAGEGSRRPDPSLVLALAKSSRCAPRWAGSSLYFDVCVLTATPPPPPHPSSRCQRLSKALGRVFGAFRWVGVSSFISAGLTSPFSVCKLWCFHQSSCKDDSSSLKKCFSVILK